MPTFEKNFIMKKILLSLSVLLTGSLVSAQTVLLDEGFESYTNFAITGFGNWQTLDLDGRPTFTGGGPTESTTWQANWLNRGAPMAYQIFNPSAANVTNNLTIIPNVDKEVRNFDPHGGSKYAACWDATQPEDPLAPPTPNNDWLITPAVTLGATSNLLSFWVKSLSSTYGLEKYRVGVYVGSGTPNASANFTIIAPTPGTGTLSAPYPSWGQGVYNLDAYAGQTVRIGIQCASTDVYMFMVDDVKITTGGALATQEVSKKSTTSVYPNPTKGEINIKTDKKVKLVSILDLAGRAVTKTDSNKADISSLPKGTYLVQVDFADGTSTSEKVIKQ